jgi:hypothetical protein
MMPNSEVPTIQLGTISKSVDGANRTRKSGISRQASTCWGGPSGFGGKIGKSTAFLSLPSPLGWASFNGSSLAGALGLVAGGGGGWLATQTKLTITQAAEQFSGMVRRPLATPHSLPWPQ